MPPSLLRRLWSMLADLVYPRSCGACSRPLAPGGELEICGTCAAELPFMLPPYCLVCGTAFGAPGRKTRCGRCRRRRPAFLSARGAFRYEGVIRKCIHAFKFSGRRELAASLGTLMARGLEDAGILKGADCIVPVPLHPERLRERGYDQAFLLARRFSEIVSLPLKPGILMRVRPTRAQVGMDVKSRALNVKGAFAVRPGMEPRDMKVLLVDDVMTTGATADAAARTLLDSGVREVRVAALARD